MNKKTSKSGLGELANFSEAERRASAVLNLLLVRGVITSEQRDEHLAGAINAVLGEQLWVRVRAKANAMGSNEVSTAIAEAKKAAFVAWLKNHLHDYQSGEKAIDAAIAGNVVAWGRHQMRKEITAFKKAQQPKP